MSATTARIHAISIGSDVRITDDPDHGWTVERRRGHTWLTEGHHAELRDAFQFVAHELLTAEQRAALLAKGVRVGGIESWLAACERRVVKVIEQAVVARVAAAASQSACPPLAAHLHS